MAEASLQRLALGMPKIRARTLRVAFTCCSAAALQVSSAAESKISYSVEDARVLSFLGSSGVPAARCSPARANGFHTSALLEHLLCEQAAVDSIEKIVLRVFRFCDGAKIKPGLMVKPDARLPSTSHLLRSRE